MQLKLLSQTGSAIKHGKLAVINIMQMGGTLAVVSSNDRIVQDSTCCAMLERMLCKADPMATYCPVIPAANGAQCLP